MSAFSEISEIDLGARLGESVLCLQGDELHRELSHIVSIAFQDATAAFIQAMPDSIDLGEACYCPVSAEAFYLLSGKKGEYNEQDLNKLNVLAGLTARLFSTRSRMDERFQKSLRQQLHQTQILDQIHESVITMDLAGFILSWNRGAENLFGYSSSEVVGKNILFLYEGEESEEMGMVDNFLQYGGREMEVSRRKKNGERFWASLSLSPLRDNDGHAVGIIGYLSDITERKKAEQRINYLAYYDALTDLPNRSLFKQLVDKALLQSLRSNTVGALLFIDLNRFKPVNDTLGRHVGDVLLKQVAQRFRTALRENDIVARLGSDEFAVGILDINHHYHASLVVQKILAVMDSEFSVDGHALRINASIGISAFPQDGNDADTLLQKADIAMYKAKRGDGGLSGSYAFYNDSMNQSIANRLHLESGLRKALENAEFYVLYQPKVDLKTNKMIGVETLLRWNHPDKGHIAPAEFIPVAEETGLIVQLDSWVMDMACAQARCWQDQGLPEIRIAVNVSAKEFNDDLPERILTLISKHQITPAWLEIEITESMLMHHTENVIAIMEKITALGVALALDDFGTGYSSLSYLKRFPIETLKIDRSFILGIPQDQNDCAIASAIIHLSKQLGLKVIAEGVETKEQLSFLANAGCDEVQGFLFARPLTPDQIQILFSEFNGISM